MDVKDVQLLVGAAAAAADVFSPTDTHQTIEQILEELNFPTDPAQLQAILGDIMAGEDLNAVIAALDNSETRCRLPAESPHTQPSQEPTADPAEQGPTVVEDQQEVTAKLEVSGIKESKDDAGTTSAFEQDLSQPPTQILEAVGPERELGTIFTGEDLFQFATQVLDLNDPKELDFLKDIDINELKDLDLKDIDLEGINIADVIASLQNQQYTTETGSNIPHQGKIDINNPQESNETTNGEIGGTVNNSNKDIAEESCTGDAAQRYSGESEGNPTGSPKNDSVPFVDIHNARQKENLLHSNGTTNSHTGSGILYQEQTAQVSTDDGSLEFSALDELDGSKLLEIQNAIQGFGGMPSFNQLVSENTDGSAITAAPTSGLLSSRPLDNNIETQLIRASLATHNVNVDQIPQEVVSMSLGKLLDTSNVNMSSLSQDTQEQLLWLVNQMNNSIHPQDEYADEGDDGDDDKSKKQARIREENRERKKRWRESNQDRNKDNDLRCRVTKRAAKLFGNVDTNEKKAWMEAEFLKRKEKREAKERARYHDDRVSTSPCFGSYPQQHHNHSGGTSATFSSSLQPVSVNDNRESTGNPLDSQGNSFRNRASSVAESATSSVNDNDGPDSASAGALQILSNPEAAQKLLQNSEAMQLLSNNPEVLAFLQSVIQSNQSQPSIGDSISNRSSGAASITNVCSDVNASVTTDMATMPAAVPQANHPIPDPHQQVSEEIKSSIDISIFFEMSEEELEAKLNTMDTDTAQIVLTQLLEMQEGGQEETFLETTGPSTTPVEEQMGLDPDVQRILDTPGDHNHEVQLNLSLVNDKLINFSAEEFSFTHLAFDEGSHANLGLDMMMDLGGEPGDINTKLLQALQGVLEVNPIEQLPFLEATPRAPPPTPQKSTSKKRPAPGSEEEQQEPSPPRKRHQASPTKALPEMSPDTAQAIAHLLQTSGIDFQRFGVATSLSPSPARTSMAPSYPTNHMPRYAPVPVPAVNPTCMMPNTYNAPNSTTPRPAIPKPPVTTASQQKPMSAAAAHAASFGNSAAMNQRLMPPPAYRPPNLGVGYGGFNSIPAIPKKKPDERIVKAMGFPPMLAGIKKKAPS